MRKFLKSKVGFLNPSKEILNNVPQALPLWAVSGIMAGQWGVYVSDFVQTCWDKGIRTH